MEWSCTLWCFSTGSIWNNPPTFLSPCGCNILGPAHWTSNLPNYFLSQQTLLTALLWLEGFLIKLSVKIVKWTCGARLLHCTLVFPKIPLSFLQRKFVFPTTQREQWRVPLFALMQLDFKELLWTSELTLKCSWFWLLPPLSCSQSTRCLSFKVEVRTSLVLLSLLQVGCSVVNSMGSFSGLAS